MACVSLSCLSQASLSGSRGSTPTKNPIILRSDESSSSRRTLLLQSSGLASLAAIFNFSGTRPDYLGIQKNPPSLALCPPTPNCISTSEEANDPSHYVPPWTYNPEDGRGRKNPATREQAMKELLAVISSTKPENYTPNIVKNTDDYVYVEYQSPYLGFVDDVEFWFPPGNRSLVEYRSASRVGSSDFDANRKRIRALRKALEKKGWQSIGF
ncbi:uncharacterized protein LOC9658373 isoform X1 [Selaginella moellendorffii]|nr:uncharacterized protein LOC9658373 isoform X1 [Selaginella moellendorffii]|eukprot:XP_002974431.2 uncharacterized protein LOC9658373 isoform X1 [Selaginella moellendorffii]